MPDANSERDEPADLSAAGDRSLVVVLNAGSSTLKYDLVARGGDVVSQGTVERVGSAGGFANHAEATAQAFDNLNVSVPNWLERTVAVGHRLVHGGPTLWQPTRIDKRVLAELEAQTPLAPLHIPAALQVIRAAIGLLPDVPHVAVFDTGFHHDLPAVARTYALPPEVADRFAIRRYGFHGISVEYIVARLAQLAPKARRAIVCHLGAGASITAILDGNSRDTAWGSRRWKGCPWRLARATLTHRFRCFWRPRGG